MGRGLRFLELATILLSLGRVGWAAMCDQPDLIGGAAQVVVNVTLVFSPDSSWQPFYQKTTAQAVSLEELGS
eukprot:scaffold488298_cov37-Prasinocladus_malaysianus.AAC.1